MDRKLNVAFSFLLIVLFISVATVTQKWNILLGLVLSTGISLLSFLWGKLSLSGLFAAIVIGTYTFGFGGWSTAGLLLLFFLSSALMSGYADTEQPERDRRRNGRQVWSNGIWFLIWFIAFIIFDASVFAVAAVAAIAAATADTWGTEIGTMAAHKTYCITSLRQVKPGTDGGISIIGTAETIVGSALIAIVSKYVFPFSNGVILCIFTAGFLGSLLDSYFGAIFQRSSISIPLPLAEYKVSFNNNTVNVLATGMATLLAIIFKLIFV